MATKYDKYYTHKIVLKTGCVNQIESEEDSSNL